MFSLNLKRPKLKVEVKSFEGLYAIFLVYVNNIPIFYTKDYEDAREKAIAWYEQFLTNRDAQ